jgi:hypothetical protein
LNVLRNNDQEVVCVFVCGDTALPYLDKYLQFLMRRIFNPLSHDKLLLTERNLQHSVSMAESCKQLFSEVGVVVVRPLRNLRSACIYERRTRPSF